MLITSEQLELVYDWAFDSAARIVLSGQQVEPAVLSARFINGKLRAPKIHGFVGGFRSLDDKNRAAAYVKELIARPQVDVACFVCESWILAPADIDNPTPDEMITAALAVALDIPPSQHPTRRECVMFYFYTKLYDCTAYAMIERPANRLVRTKLWYPTEGRTVGRFSRDPIPDDAKDTAPTRKAGADDE